MNCDGKPSFWNYPFQNDESKNIKSSQYFVYFITMNLNQIISNSYESHIKGSMILEEALYQWNFMSENSFH